MNAPKRHIEYQVTNLEQRRDRYEPADELCCKAWPEFMLHDSICNRYWGDMITCFGKYQLVLTHHDDIVAVVNAVPIRFDGELSSLPDAGWDWALEKSIRDSRSHQSPNTLIGIQVVVNPRYRHCGLSYCALAEMKKVARDSGFTTLAIPVRPSDKHHYPLQPMTDYIRWTNAHDAPFDNWIRVHVKSGGTIVRVCSRAMLIEGSIDEWAQWTGMQFPASGQYIVPGALNPIEVNLENNSGVYVEPNVWIVHGCA